MNRLICLASVLSLVPQSALAARAAGGSALALAALVASYSPVLSVEDKTAMALMFSGNLRFSFPKHERILVRAAAVLCRASDVDITLHSCVLTFGSKIVAINGREAHELFATVAEAGVPPEGAAGSIGESLSERSIRTK